MSIQKAYDAWSATYDGDRNRTRDLDARAIRRVLAGMRPESVLELGCGTGKNTRFLARIARKVLALDFSEGMLARAKASLPHAHVSFDVADLTRRWPCPDASVDLIACDLVLEHIERLSFVFRQARRVLRPGGRFFISELHPSWQYQGKQATFRHRGKAVPIAAFLHDISEFVGAARDNGFAVERLQEWRHDADAGKPPRLVSFLFGTPAGARGKLSARTVRE